MVAVVTVGMIVMVVVTNESVADDGRSDGRSLRWVEGEGEEGTFQRDEDDE